MEICIEVDSQVTFSPLANHVETPGSGADMPLLVSAFVATNGDVSEDNSNFINGNCTNPSTGNYTCPFITGYWKPGTTPHCWVFPTDAPQNRSSTRTGGTTEFTVELRNSTGGLVNSAFTLFCHGFK